MYLNAIPINCSTIYSSQRFIYYSESKMLVSEIIMELIANGHKSVLLCGCAEQ